MAGTDAATPGGAVVRPGRVDQHSTEPCNTRCAECAARTTVVESAAVTASPCTDDPESKSMARPVSACPLLEGRGDDWVRCCTARFLPLAHQVCGDDATARDAMHDSWVAVLQGIGRYRGRSPACSWVRTIVRRTAMRTVRRFRRADADGQPTRLTAPAGANPEDDAHRRRLRRVLLNAIAQLPPEDRLIVRLRDIDNLPPQQVAVRLHLSRTAVSSRLHRAHSRLRRRLGHLGLKPTDDRDRKSVEGDRGRRPVPADSPEKKR